jgi:hypothetical protein
MVRPARVRYRPRHREVVQMPSRVIPRSLRATSVRPILVALFLACRTLLQAQTEADSALDGQWHFRVVPYFWASGIEGTLSVSGINEVPLEASFSDILSDFDIGLLARFEARRDRAGFAVDFMYLNLGADVPTDRPILGLLDLRADVRQLTAEGFGFYRVISGGREQKGHLDLLLGLRYTETRTRLEATGIGGANLEGTQRTLDWLDLMGGARFRLPLGARAGLTGRGDLAALGSDLTWNALAGLDVALGRRFATGAEYRWLDIDYDSGEGVERRILNLRYSGPYLWFAYSW